jgi:cell division septal protein FtsQ
MWFNRKPKNRRLGREAVLEVKLRSNLVRVARSRMAVITLGVTFAVVFGVYVAWRMGEWTLAKLVYENKAFALQEIDIQTDGVIAIDQLRRWTGVKPEQNLLALDLARVKRDLELCPLIQSASVERVLPHSLRIRVVEREPLAQINVPRPRLNGGGDWITYQIDAEGCVMLPLDPPQPAGQSKPPVNQLPLISGIDGRELRAGRRIEMPQLRAALELVLAFDHSPMAGLADLNRIDISLPEVLVVTTGQGSEVTFGLADLEQQLRRWRGVYEAGRKANRAIASLDLAVTNNIPTRWLEANTTGQSTARSPKPLRLKKKHV